MALWADGQTIEPSVSVPIASAHRFAAGATAEPELEPHGSQPRPYGLRVKPRRALQPFVYRPASATAGGTMPRKFAHSERFALPRMTAPAARNRATILASRGTRLPTSAREPAVVSIASLVAMLSLTRTGMPWSGPRTRPARRSPVTPSGDRQRVGVRFDHGMEEGIDPFDPPEVGRRQLGAAQPARRHKRLERWDRGFEPRGGLVGVPAWRQRRVDRHIVATRESNDPGRLTTRVGITLVRRAVSRPAPRGLVQPPRWLRKQSLQ